MNPEAVIIKVKIVNLSECLNRIDICKNPAYNFKKFMYSYGKPPNLKKKKLCLIFFLIIYRYKKNRKFKENHPSKLRVMGFSIKQKNSFPMRAEPPLSVSSRFLSLLLTQEHSESLLSSLPQQLGKRQIIHGFRKKSNSTFQIVTA